MSARRLPPPWDKIAARRKGVSYVPAAEGYPARLNGRPLSPEGIHGLPLPTEERGRRTAALLAAALALQPPD